MFLGHRYETNFDESSSYCLLLCICTWNNSTCWIGFLEEVAFQRCRFLRESQLFLTAFFIWLKKGICIYRSMAMKMILAWYISLWRYEVFTFTSSRCIISRCCRNLHAHFLFIRFMVYYERPATMLRALLIGSTLILVRGKTNNAQRRKKLLCYDDFVLV